MVVHRRKKVRKYRGSSTHGGGNRKKRRGAGSRGGRGMAGTGKRSGHKKNIYPHYLGSIGFLPRRGISAVEVINVGHFTKERVEKWIVEGKATKEGSAFVIDLNALGYGKLLGTGQTTLKLKITVDSCSPSAVEKIKAAGGEVVA